jgi:hypothetical protein
VLVGSTVAYALLYIAGTAASADNILCVQKERLYKLVILTDY